MKILIVDSHDRAGQPAGMDAVVEQPRRPTEALITPGRRQNVAATPATRIGLGMTV